MASIHMILLLRKAAQDGKSITMEEAAKLEAAKQAKFKQERDLRDKLFDLEFDAMREGTGRPLRGKEN